MCECLDVCLWACECVRFFVFVYVCACLICVIIVMCDVDWSNVMSYMGGRGDAINVILLFRKFKRVSMGMDFYNFYLPNIFEFTNR